MSDTQWWHKALIGALGGLALALLKLIDAKFYLASIFSVESQAAYLTYFCYMILGSVTAVFLCDHDEPPAKMRKSAFLLGLLAPSVLLAIANQPIKPPPADTPAIPRLGGWFVPSAHAQEAAPASPPAAATQARVVNRSSYEPSFGDAVAAALGRKTLSTPYAYVVGVTSDQKKALSTATKLNLALAGQAGTPAGLPSAQVLQFKGETDYYVLLGGLASKEKQSSMAGSVKGLGIELLSGSKTPTTMGAEEQKELGKLLLNAKVVAAPRLGGGQ
ncbi:MAG: hypothetical protein HYZ17_08660 [Betaproteobacteria bacterium]|nr:hypothetical protein [Betaproteobacteria bacterium]